MRIHRFPPIGALLIAALAITVGPGAWASHAPNYPHQPAPVIYGDEAGEENNPTCAWLGQREEPPQTWNELKVDEAPPNGTYEDQGSPGGPGSLVLTVSNSDGYVIDWSSEDNGVDAFVVKGGSKGSNVYFYDPEATADERVHSPLNKNGKVPQISHISVCYDEEESGGGGQSEGPQQGGGDQGGGQSEGPQQGGGDQGGGQSEGPQQGGGDQGGGQPDQGGEEQNERPQNERPQNDAQQDGGNQPQDQGGQQDGGGQPQGDEDQRASQQNDGGQQDRGSDDGSDTPTERTPDDEVDSDDGSGDQGEGDVLGESESDDGIVEEGDAGNDDEDAGSDDEDDDDRDRLPFTGAPLVFLALIGLMLVLTGLVGRRELR